MPQSLPTPAPDVSGLGFSLFVKASDHVGLAQQHFARFWFKGWILAHGDDPSSIGRLARLSAKRGELSRSETVPGIAPSALAKPAITAEQYPPLETSVATRWWLHSLILGRSRQEVGGSTD